MVYCHPSFVAGLLVADILLATHPVAHRTPLSRSASTCCNYPDRLPVLRARYGRMALQSIAFVAAVLVIADGLLAAMKAMNLAGVLPWTYVRAFGVIGRSVLEISSASVMPLHAAAGVRTPVRTGPFQMAALAAHQVDRNRLDGPFFWSYEAFAIWDHPGRTAWLLVAIFAAAFLVDTFFRGASFCNVFALWGNSILPVRCFRPSACRLRSQATCRSLRPTTALREPHSSAVANGQNMPQKAGNMDCTCAWTA